MKLFCFSILHITLQNRVCFSLRYWVHGGRSAPLPSCRPYWRVGSPSRSWPAHPVAAPCCSSAEPWRPPVQWEERHCGGQLEHRDHRDQRGQSGWTPVMWLFKTPPIVVDKVEDEWPTRGLLHRVDVSRRTHARTQNDVGDDPAVKRIQLVPCSHSALDDLCDHRPEPRLQAPVDVFKKLTCKHTQHTHMSIKAAK